MNSKYKKRTNYVNSGEGVKRTHTKRSGVRRENKMKIDKASNDYVSLKSVQKMCSAILERQVTEKEALSYVLRICNKDINTLALYLGSMK